MFDVFFMHWKGMDSVQLPRNKRDYEKDETNAARALHSPAPASARSTIPAQ